MSVFLNLAGVIWCILGVGVFVFSASATHEILGCLAVSFGIIFWGFASILRQLTKMTDKLAQPVANGLRAESPSGQ